MLPSPYKKEANPWQHFDNPEALARWRVCSEIERANGDLVHFPQEQSYSGWYGHGVMIHYDEIIVMECAGVTMRVVFPFRKMLDEELQRQRQFNLFNN